MFLIRNSSVSLLRTRSAVKIVPFWASLGLTQDPPRVVLGIRGGAVHPYPTLDPPALGDQLFDRLPDVRVFMEPVAHRSPRAVAKLKRSWM